MRKAAQKGLQLRAPAGAHEGDHALMGSGSGQLGELLARFLANADSGLAALGDEMSEAFVVALAGNQYVVKTAAAGLECLLDGMQAVENFHMDSVDGGRLLGGPQAAYWSAMSDTTRKTFRAVLEATGTSLHWVIARVPVDLKKAWPAWKTRRVFGEINGFAFRTSLFPASQGKGHVLLVNKQMQAGPRRLQVQRCIYGRAGHGEAGNRLASGIGRCAEGRSPAAAMV